MHSRHGWYDPALLAAFAELRGGASPDLQCEELPLGAVRPGMVFVEDVRTPAGLLLIARGQEVTVSLASRLRNLGRDAVPTGPVKMVIRAPS